MILKPRTTLEEIFDKCVADDTGAIDIGKYDHEFLGERLTEAYALGQQEIKESLREKVERLREPNISEMTSGSEFMTPRMYRALGKEQALDQVLNLLSDNKK